MATITELQTRLGYVQTAINTLLQNPYASVSIDGGMSYTAFTLTELYEIEKKTEEQIATKRASLRIGELPQW